MMMMMIRLQAITTFQVAFVLQLIAQTRRPTSQEHVQFFRISLFFDSGPQRTMTSFLDNTVTLVLMTTDSSKSAFNSL
jgi:hypothetical protein